MVVTWSVGGAMASDSGAMFFNSILLIIAISVTILLFVVQDTIANKTIQMFSTCGKMYLYCMR
jgi:hypothetical protein